MKLRHSRSIIPILSEIAQRIKITAASDILVGEQGDTVRFNAVFIDDRPAEDISSRNGRARGLQFDDTIDGVGIVCRTEEVRGSFRPNGNEFFFSADHLARAGKDGIVEHGAV